MSLWTPENDYYWSGPEGWTICRVGCGGTEKFEIWSGGLHSGGTMQGRHDTLIDAQDAYYEISHAKVDLHV